MVVPGFVKKNLLILSGANAAIDGIILAQKLGFTVTVCDRDDNAPGRKVSDSFIHADIYNVNEVLKSLQKFTKKNKIDGVMTIGTDAVRTVAAISNKYNLPGITKKTSILTSDKFKMKKCFEKHSIKTPKFIMIKTEKELKDSLRYYPNSVLKPIDGRGARGVIRITKDSDINWSFENSIKFSPSKKLILEKWMSGPQISTESVVINGKTFLCGIADREYSSLKKTYPHVIEDGGETPSRFSPKINEKITKALDNIAHIIGMKNGVIKGDIVLEKGIPYVIEVASRLSGGFFSTVTIPLVYHINLIEKAIMLAMGLKIQHPPEKLEHFCFQSQRYFFSKEGTVKKISYNQKLPKYVKYFELTVKPGDKLEKTVHHSLRRGSVIVIGKTRSEAISRALKIKNNVKIVIK
jgi:biotin carboxylase